MSEYTEALEKFNFHLKTADNTKYGVVLQLMIGADFSNQQVAAIHKALRIADKLMQEPSIEIWISSIRAYAQNCKPHIEIDEYAMLHFYKAMRDQLIAEVEEDMQDVADAEKAYAETTRFWTQEEMEEELGLNVEK